jgi:alpha-amylase
MRSSGRPGPPSCGSELPDPSLARKLYVYAAQEDYFNEKKCIGLVRRGTCVCDK